MNFPDGTIFYGTNIDNIYCLDSKGIEKPFIRNEHYISVSCSNYKGYLSCKEHDDLLYLAKIYTKKYNAAVIDKKGFLKWNAGYKNSLTYIDGFGACETDQINLFGKSVKNDKIGKNITAVIYSTFQKDFIIPSESFKTDDISFEYLSTALHPFLIGIFPEMIFSWIADKENYSIMKDAMNHGKLKKKPIYLVDEL